MAEAPRPRFQRLFEAAASVIGLAHGRDRLELVFEDGPLVQWWTHADRKPPRELERVEAEAAWVAVTGGEVSFGQNSNNVTGRTSNVPAHWGSSPSTCLNACSAAAPRREELEL